jgi:hypothetical protein
MAEIENLEIGNQRELLGVSFSHFFQTLDSLAD